MTTLNSDLPYDAATPDVDFEVLRAQLVNCLFLACNLLSQQNPDVSAHCVLSRFIGLGVLFNLHSAQFESRRYILKLTSPDGTRARLIRLNDEGGEAPQDDVDLAYLNAIGHCLEDTVHAAWKQMVPAEPVLTHLTPSTLH